MKPPAACAGKPGRVYHLEITGYCPCQQCCNWERNWLGRTVVSTGPNKGKPKSVGMTASGTRARPGTIAADTNLFPFGTIIYVPGYGYGKVEDRGGDIQGSRLDLFFKRHSDAEEWGRVTEDVRVWKPDI